MFKTRFISMLVLLAAVVTGAVAQETYKVSVKEGTEDATNWTITPAEATTTGVAAGTEVKATYNGTKKVKSVKAVKKKAPATDLSMVDCAGTARTDGQWTANCYMVHTAGDYKLPLVYGNAIKSGAANTAAYTGVSGSNTTATFPRHDGEAIADPWIKNNGITVTQAELLWQDAQGLVTAVGISGDYLTLTVGKDAAEQEGNALVAAKDAQGTIVWSWHIWVTKQTFATLTTITVSDYGYKVTPVNLGWVGDATSGATGYCTFYQWGRKDAFIPSTGIGDDDGNGVNHTVYNINNNDVTTTAFTLKHENSVTIGDNIQHPTVHYRNTSTNGPCNTRYYNMWDAQQTSNAENTAAATVKTVYDPCPPGFCVPTFGLYNYIKTQYRPTFNAGYTYKGVFFPASGERDYYYGYIDGVGTVNGVGTDGYYWSATPYNGTNSRYFRFTSSGWYLGSGYRFNGFPVRAVAE